VPNNGTIIADVALSGEHVMLPLREGRPPLSKVVPVDLDHFYTFGEVHETLEAVDHVDQMLGRLKRRSLLSDDAFKASKRDLAEIRLRIEQRLRTPTS
jgi:hypothetical protein